jgi:hypothetical protein
MKLSNPSLFESLLQAARHCFDAYSPESQLQFLPIPFDTAALPSAVKFDTLARCTDIACKQFNPHPSASKSRAPYSTSPYGLSINQIDY